MSTGSEYLLPESGETDLTVAESEDAWLAAGQQIGPYVLERQLRGRPTDQQSAVWEALNKEHERRDVVKVYELSKLDGSSQRRVAEEGATARSWSRLEGVVATYFAGVIGPYYVIAMEAMGQTVAEHLRARRQTPANRRPQATYIEWIVTVANSLHELHGAGLRHRDVTAANILISRDMKNARLTDFSHCLQGEDARGLVVGTRPEMAPEQQAGDYTPLGDQFQLGRVAWRLLASGTFLEDPDKHLTPSVRRVLTRATEQYAPARWDSMQEFGAMLLAAHEHLDRVVAAWIRELDVSARYVLSRAACLLSVLSILVPTVLAPRMARAPDRFVAGWVASGVTAGVIALCIAISAAAARLRKHNGTWEQVTGVSWIAAQPWLGTTLTAAWILGLPLVTTSSADVLPSAVVVGVCLYAVVELVGSVLVGFRRTEGRWFVAYIETLVGKPSWRTLVAAVLTVGIIGSSVTVSAIVLHHERLAHQRKAAVRPQ